DNKVKNNAGFAPWTHSSPKRALYSVQSSRLDGVVFLSCFVGGDVGSCSEKALFFVKMLCPILTDPSELIEWILILRIEIFIIRIVSILKRRHATVSITCMPVTNIQSRMCPILFMQCTSKGDRSISRNGIDANTVDMIDNRSHYVTSDLYRIIAFSR